MSAIREKVDAASELGRSFKGAIAAMRRLRGREQRSPEELGDAKYGLLFGLRDQSEMSLRELAAVADLSPASATEMLDGLEAAGLVRRARSELDRRRVVISLTEHGRELVEQRRRSFEPRWRAALAEFSEHDLLIAAAVLDRLRAMFDAVVEERAPATGTDLDQPVD